MLLRATMLLGALALTSAAQADPMFTPDQYPDVTKAAIAQFKADMPDHVSMFYGVSLLRNVQDGTDIGVLAKIYTQMGTDAPSVMSKYNCHIHETGEIECHPA